jgi:hypothetical protein
MVSAANNSSIILINTKTLSILSSTQKLSQRYFRTLISYSYFLYIFRTVHQMTAEVLLHENFTN